MSNPQSHITLRYAGKLKPFRWPKDISPEDFLRLVANTFSIKPSQISGFKNKNGNIFDLNYLLSNPKEASKDSYMILVDETSRKRSSSKNNEDPQLSITQILEGKKVIEDSSSKPAPLVVVNNFIDFERTFLRNNENNISVLFVIDKRDSLRDIHSQCDPVIKQYSSRFEFFCYVKKESSDISSEFLVDSVPSVILFAGARKFMEIPFDYSDRALTSVLSKIQPPGSDSIFLSEAGGDTPPVPEDYLTLLDNLSELSDKEYYLIKSCLLQQQPDVINLFNKYLNLRNKDRQDLLREISKLTGTAMKRLGSQDGEREDKRSLLERPQVLQNNFVMSASSFEPPMSRSKSKEMSFAQEKFIQITAELERKFLLSEHSASLIKCLILEENIEVFNFFNEYLQESLDDISLSKRLVRLSEKLSPSIVRPTSPLPKKDELIKLVNTLVRRRLRDESEVSLLNRLILEGDELLYSAFEVFESDRDEEDLLDTLIRIMNNYKKSGKLSDLGKTAHETAKKVTLRSNQFAETQEHKERPPSSSYFTKSRSRSKKLERSAEPRSQEKHQAEVRFYNNNAGSNKRSSTQHEPTLLDRINHQEAKPESRGHQRARSNKFFTEDQVPIAQALPRPETQHDSRNKRKERSAQHSNGNIQKESILHIVEVVENRDSNQSSQSRDTRESRDREIKERERPEQARIHEASQGEKLIATKQNHSQLPPKKPPTPQPKEYTQNEAIAACKVSPQVKALPSEEYGMFVWMFKNNYALVKDVLNDYGGLERLEDAFSDLHAISVKHLNMAIADKFDENLRKFFNEAKKIKTSSTHAAFQCFKYDQDLASLLQQLEEIGRTMPRKTPEPSLAQLESIRSLNEQNHHIEEAKISSIDFLPAETRPKSHTMHELSHSKKITPEKRESQNGDKTPPGKYTPLLNRDSRTDSFKDSFQLRLKLMPSNQDAPTPNRDTQGKSMLMTPVVEDRGLENLNVIIPTKSELNPFTQSIIDKFYESQEDQKKNLDKFLKSLGSFSWLKEEDIAKLEHLYENYYYDLYEVIFEFESTKNLQEYERKLRDEILTVDLDNVSMTSASPRERKRMIAYHSYKALLHYLKKEKMISDKQYRIYHYLYIEEEITILACYEVYQYTKDLKEFLDTLFLIEKIQYFKNDKDDLDMIVSINDAAEQQMKILYNLKKSLNLDTRVVLEKAIKSGDDTVMKLYQAYKKEKSGNSARNKANLIHKLVTFASEKADGIFDNFFSFQVIKAYEHQIKLERNSGNTVVARRRELVENYLCNGLLKDVDDVEVLYEAIDIDHYLIHSIFEIHEYSKDKQDFIENLTLVYKNLSKSCAISVLRKYQRQYNLSDTMIEFICSLRRTKDKLTVSAYDVYNANKNEIDFLENIVLILEKKRKRRASGDLKVTTYAK